MKVVDICILLIVLTSCAVASLYTYKWAAASGMLGDEALQKFNLQSRADANPWEFIVGGRSEILVSTMAIADSPLIGHGSWAKDYKYILLLLDLRREYSESSSQSDLELLNLGGLIPTHSYIFGAWVEAGILGAVFWFAIIYFCIFIFLPFAISSRSIESMYGIILLPGFIWDILFSPFGAYERVEVAATLAIMITARALGKPTYSTSLWATASSANSNSIKPL